MKNYEIVYLANALKKVDAPVMGGWFNYAVSDATKKAEDIAENIMAAIVPDEEYSKYEERMNLLREEHSEKDENGNSIFTQLDNGLRQYSIPVANDPESDFMKSFHKLKEVYKEAIAQREKQLEFLEEENKDFEPLEITYKDLPDGLSRQDMNAVYMIMKKDHE